MHTPSRFIVERVRGGEAVDVTILTADASDDARSSKASWRAASRLRAPASGSPCSAGAPKPDVSSAEAVKRTLLAAKTFARNEGAESGKHMLRVFERLGIVEEMKAKTIAMPVNTGYVAQLVADAKVDMAAQQMPELHAVAGVVPIAAAAGTANGHSVRGRSVARPAAEPEAVDALLTFLASAGGRPPCSGPKGLDPPGT